MDDQGYQNLRRIPWRNVIYALGSVFIFVILFLLGRGYVQLPIDEDIAVFAITIIITLAAGFVRFVEGIREERKDQERIEEAEAARDEQTEKVGPAWDVARVTLEKYFNRNLRQIDWIFFLSLLVMLVGFSLIVWGIAQAILDSNVEIAVITAAAGIITEFIGATFLIIYRATIKQAITYTKTLERINAVGMAMSILDTLPDNADVENLKHSTKASVVTALMSQIQGQQVDIKADATAED